MLAVIPQSLYSSLVTRNLIAALIVVFAAADSKPVCLAQQAYSSSEAFAGLREPQGNLHNANGLALGASFPSPSAESEWLEKLDSFYAAAGLGHAQALSNLKAMAPAGKMLSATQASVISIAGKLGWFCCEMRSQETRKTIDLLANASGKALTSPTAFAWALSNLAVVYKAQGRSEAAITLLERALAIAGRAPRKDNYRQGVIENQLALYCGEAGRAEDAEAQFHDAIAAFEKSGNSASIAAALYNLALLYGGQRRYPEAADAALRSLSLLTNAEEQDHSRVFKVLNALAGAYNAQARYKDAEQTLLRAFAIAQEEFQTTDPSLSHVAANLAVIYKAEERPFEAIAMFNLALKAAEIAVGPEDVWTGMIANRLAVSYFEQGKLAEAEPLFKRAIAIGDSSPDENNLFLAAALFNLSALYTRQSRYEEAEALLERSLFIRRRAYGPNHPAVEEVQNAIVAVQGARQEAREPFALSEAGER